MDDILISARSALQPFLQASSLSDLYAAYKTIPANYVLAGHCLFAATMAPEFKHRFLLHFWFTFLAGFGGGLLSSLLMMDPVRAPINILSNNAVGVTWFVCWWLIVYAPFDVVGRIHSLLPVKMVTKACTMFMRANLIINRVDLAVSMFPGVIAAPLILGTLAGCGGKMLTDVIRTGWGAPPAAAEVSVPTFVWRSAVLAAAGYWGLCKYTTLMSSQEAAAVVITVLVAHSLLSDLLGPNVTDFTYPVAKVAHTLSLVPMPSTNPSPAASKAAKKAAAQQQQQSAKQAPPAKQAAPAQSAVSSASKQQQQQQQAQAQAAPASKPAAAEAAPAKASSGKGGNVAAIKADSSSKNSQQNGKKSESKKSR